MGRALVALIDHELFSVFGASSHEQTPVFAQLAERSRGEGAASRLRTEAGYGTPRSNREGWSQRTVSVRIGFQVQVLPRRLTSEPRTVTEGGTAETEGTASLDNNARESELSLSAG